MAQGDPLDGHVLVLAAAKASVAAERLPELVDRVQADLGPRVETYRRAYEAVHESPERWVFLVPVDHWESVGARLSLTARERGAVRRAHEEQLRRIGSREGRREEFESALDIRSAVVVGLGGSVADRHDVGDTTADPAGPTDSDSDSDSDSVGAPESTVDSDSLVEFDSDSRSR